MSSKPSTAKKKKKKIGMWFKILSPWSKVSYWGTGITMNDSHPMPLKEGKMEKMTPENGPLVPKLKKALERRLWATGPGQECWTFQFCQGLFRTQHLPTSLKNSLTIENVSAVGRSEEYLPFTGRHQDSRRLPWLRPSLTPASWQVLI
jgi:hypothetical protein